MAGAARALQRLEHRAAAEVLDERLDHVLVARDQRARSHDLGEVLEVRLGQRVGEAGRVVDDQHPARGDQLLDVGTLNVREVALMGAASGPTLELNLQPSMGASDFAESRQGPATQLVPAWVDEVLGDGGPNSS
jgi:hypothetical protein